MKHKLTFMWHKDVIWDCWEPCRCRLYIAYFINSIGFQFSIWHHNKNKWYFGLFYKNKRFPKPYWKLHWRTFWDIKRRKHASLCCG